MCVGVGLGVFSLVTPALRTRVRFVLVCAWVYLCLQVRAFGCLYETCMSVCIYVFVVFFDLGYSLCWRVFVFVPDIGVNVCVRAFVFYAVEPPM